MDWTDLLFPKTCPCCGGELREGQTVCEHCAPDIHRNPAPHCPSCGVSLRSCRCARNARAYDRIVAPFFYEGAIRDALLRMKFGKHEDVARYLAAELREAIDARYFGEPFDLLTVVPMSRDRYASRGFNQARTLAEFLMKDPPEPLQDTLVDYGLLKKKNSHGSMQHLLGAEGRRKNIRDAVSVGPNRPLEGKSVLLLDDIVTTGATVGECATILRLAGASRVCVAAAAVTRFPEKIAGNTIQEERKRLNF